jgi:hypothetical protein
MKLTYGAPEALPLRGTAQFVKDQPHLLVFDVMLPHWGVFGSMEFKIFRDGSADAALDIATTNIGIKEYEKDKTLRLQFECHDCKFPNVHDHTYKLDGTVRFYTCAAS